MQDTTNPPNTTSPPDTETQLAELTEKVEALMVAAAAAASERFVTDRPRVVEPVSIMLDRERHMRLPFWALKKFQKVTGKSPWDHDAVWGYPPDLDGTITMIWCALLDEDPDLTLEQVERLPGMEFGNIHYLRHCLDKCWGENNPDPDPVEPGAVPNSTGGTSSTG